MCKNRDPGYSLALNRRENNTWKSIWTALPKDVTGSLRSLINGQIAFKFWDTVSLNCPDWPWTHFIAKVLNLSILLPPSCIARITNPATWPVYKAFLWNLQNLFLLIWLSSYFLLYFFSGLLRQIHVLKALKIPNTGSNTKTQTVLTHEYKSESLSEWPIRGWNQGPSPWCHLTKNVSRFEFSTSECSLCVCPLSICLLYESDPVPARILSCDCVCVSVCPLSVCCMTLTLCLPEGGHGLCVSVCLSLTKSSALHHTGKEWGTLCRNL